MEQNKILHVAVEKQWLVKKDVNNHPFYFSILNLNSQPVTWQGWRTEMPPVKGLVQPWMRTWWQSVHGALLKGEERARVIFPFGEIKGNSCFAGNGCCRKHKLLLFGSTMQEGGGVRNSAWTPCDSCSRGVTQNVCIFKEPKHAADFPTCLTVRKQHLALSKLVG